jgi:hypothetical protein
VPQLYVAVSQVKIPTLPDKLQKGGRGRKVEEEE